jgi:lipoprotein LprG
MQALNSYHFLLDQVGGGTPVGMGVEMNKAEGDIVKPDKLKATITGTFSGMSLQIQIVSVGGVVKMTNPLSGKWETPPVAFNVLGLFDPGTGVAAILKGLTDVSKLEDAEAGGVPCYHLSGSIKSENLNAITGSSVAGISIQAEVWIGKSDLLIRDIKLTGKITESEVPGIVRTLTLSKFDEPVTIELPQ